MSKDADPVILAALRELVNDAQLEASEALAIVRGHTDQRRESGRLEDEANLVFKKLERRATAARNAVEAYKMATNHEGH